MGIGKTTGWKCKGSEGFVMVGWLLQRMGTALLVFEEEQGRVHHGRAATMSRRFVMLLCFYWDFRELQWHNEFEQAS